MKTLSCGEEVDLLHLPPTPELIELQAEADRMRAKYPLANPYNLGYNLWVGFLRSKGVVDNQGADIPYLAREHESSG